MSAGRKAKGALPTHSRCGTRQTPVWLRANEDSKAAFQNDRVIERLFMTEFSIHYLISLRQVSDIRKLSGSAKLVASPTLELARLIGVVRFTVEFGTAGEDDFTRNLVSEELP